MVRTIVIRTIVVRTIGVRRTAARRIGVRTTGTRRIAARRTVVRTTGARAIEIRRIAIRAIGTTDLRAVSAAIGRIADSSSPEGEAAMAVRRETKTAVMAELAGRAVKTARVIAGGLALARAAAAALTVLRGITEAAQDREPDPETEARIRALLEMHRQRIWKRGAMMKRGAQVTLKRIRDPRRIISTRKKRR